jgi:hypothetical protein
MSYDIVQYKCEYCGKMFISIDDCTKHEVMDCTYNPSNNACNTCKYQKIEHDKYNVIKKIKCMKNIDKKNWTNNFCISDCNEWEIK